MAAAKPERTRPREKPQQIADELRALIASGALAEGDSLGHEPDLIERFGVSRPSLREALRILEAEGLISVIRGVQGGVVVHAPNRRQTARTAAIVLQSRNVSLMASLRVRVPLVTVTTFAPISFMRETLSDWRRTSSSPM